MKMPSLSKRIGITGGIGSGKSVVASLLQLYDIPVYIADTESKKLTNESPVIREKLTELIGDHLYTPKGLDKKRLSSLIFADAELLNKVNAIIHPEVNRHFQQWVAEQQTPFCAIESAILFESGFDKAVDCSLMVYAPLEIRLQRVMKRDGASEAEVRKRIANQLADEIKKERADYVIYNDDRQSLIAQVEAYIQCLSPEKEVL